ncbi:hypothetical protein [uncultured Sphingomonas sp.]|uniref:hypothetical protein n=1 Tax=uncultured Sphingomonas sp. TaxID=158754 RepID=UPI002639ACFA|nr:hypothetical protein [uncultured Sphingomonas sp.]
MKRTLALAALAALTACAPEQKNEASYDEGALFNTVNALDPAASPTPGTPVVGGRIPAAFQGRWGLVPADCTSTQGDAKGLMLVEPDRLTFYESRATVTQLATISPTEIKATLAFSGEGQTWEQETPLTLEDNGNALTRIADGQTLRYMRCGA